MHQYPQSTVSRRSFLATSAAGLAAVGLGTPTRAAPAAVAGSMFAAKPTWPSVAELRDAFPSKPPDDCLPWIWGSYYMEDWSRKDRRAMFRAMHERGIRGIYLWSRSTKRGTPVAMAEDAAAEGLRVLIHPGAIFTVYGGEFTTPATAWKQRHCESHEVKGPDRWTVPIAERHRLNAVTILADGRDAEQAATVLPIVDGAVELPDGMWRVFVHTDVPHDAGGNLFDNKFGRGGGTIDHLNETAVRGHLDHFVQPILDSAAGPMVEGVWVDSWEVAHPSWTDDLLAEFARRRGYDLRPWLHALTVKQAKSFAVKTVQADVKHTIDELLIERFYAGVAKWCAERKLIFSAQAHGTHLETIDAFGVTHVPQPELYGEGFQPYGHRDAVSAANTYGRGVVLSESYTIACPTFSWTPALLWEKHGKQLSYGVNAVCLFKFHGSKQGHASPETTAACAFDPWNTTFWDSLTPLNEAIGRSCWLMRQGRPGASVAVFREVFARSIRYFPNNEYVADFPGDGTRYCSDRITGQALREFAAVADGELKCGYGRYRVLVIDPGEEMDPAILQAIAKLVRGGTQVVALSLPKLAAGFHEREQRSNEIVALAREIFPDGSEPKKVGQGQTWRCNADDLPALLNRLGIAPDLDGESVQHLHVYRRRGPDWDLFAVRNRHSQPFKKEVSVPGSGSLSSWDALRAEIVPMVAEARGGRLHFQLELPGDGWVLLVRHDGPQPVVAQPVRTREVMTLRGAWQLVFQRHLPDDFGPSPEPRALERLQDLSVLEGLGDFAGSVSYRLRFQQPEGLSGRIILDLGEVRDAACVRVNGVEVGRLIARPFRVDVTKHVRAGENELEVIVTNRLQNAFTLGVERGVFTKSCYNGRFSKPNELSMSAWAGRAPRNPFGLVGPVRVFSSPQE